MHLLKDKKNYTNFTNLIELDGDQSKYIINKYIQVLYNKMFLIEKIKPEHIIQFIKFIDQCHRFIIII